LPNEYTQKGCKLHIIMCVKTSMHAIILLITFHPNGKRLQQNSASCTTWSNEMRIGMLLRWFD